MPSRPCSTSSLRLCSQRRVEQLTWWCPCSNPETTRLKNTLVKLDHFRDPGWRKKHIWNHHLVFMGFVFCYFTLGTPCYWRYDWTPKSYLKHRTSGGIWKTRVFPSYHQDSTSRHLVSNSLSRSRRSVPCEFGGLVGWMVTVRSLVKTTNSKQQQQQHLDLIVDSWLETKKCHPVIWFNIFNDDIERITITINITIQNPRKIQDTSKEDKSFVNPTGIHCHKSWWFGFFETWNVLPSLSGFIYSNCQIAIGDISEAASPDRNFTWEIWIQPLKT